MEDRINRALKQKMYLLDIKDNSYVVEGSSGVNYLINLSDKKATCNCQDFIRRRLMCKHIMFILIRVYKNNIFNYSVYQNFTSMCNSKLLYKEKLYKENVLENTENTENTVSIEQCLICFENTDKNSTKCKTCVTVCHNSCLNIWLKNKNTCPMCRSIWKKEYYEEDYMEKFKQIQIT